MDARERFLTVINKEKPDRLPCQVHIWMSYYLKKYLGGIDQYQAYEYFNMDTVIYVSPEYIYDNNDLSNWQVEHKELGKDKDENWLWINTVTTPEGILTQKGARNEFTEWTTKYLINTEKDFEIWNKYAEVPPRKHF